MGISDLHTFVEAECSNACVSVDLLKISRGFQKTNSRVEIPNNNCHCGLVVDAECCLDRLYGGFFSDWVCGGQFNRMTDFLKSLIDSCQNANLDFVVFFNGALEKEKLNDWFVQQKLQKEKIRHVFRHIITKGTPPPKVLWNAPVFLQGALRMALANLKVSVECSVEDHHQEIIAFCRKHALQGIVAQNPLYVIFDPPRYFSANNLKLTYKGSLETTEYIVDEIAKCLNLNPNRFCIFAALLGNHILTDNDLHDFRCQFPNDAHIGNRVTTKLDAAMIKITCDFVRNLQSVSNLDQVGDLVFQNCQPADKHLLIGKFKQSVQYYQEGTSGSFLKYRSRFKTPGVSRLGAVLPNSSIPNNSIPNSSIPNGAFTKDSCTRVQPEATNAESNMFASNLPADAAPVTDFVLPAVMDDIIRIARERHQRGLMHPKIYQVLTEGEVRLPVVLEDDNSSDLPSYVDLYRPLRQSVYSILFNLNKLKIVHEQSCKAKGVDAAARSFEVFVREWVVRKGLSGPTCEFTVARPVDWKVPSIERMWLGLSEDDRLRRLRAFLTVMRSDTPFILAGLLVPQHMLLMVCVLRYILHHGHVLQSAELNAFLAMATSPLLNDVQTVQDVKLPDVTVRGVHLATLFMSGVEMAVMANDVCGAPVPVGMCCPWLFFNGKLLHYKLLKANSPLIDLCDGQVEQVLRVEKMRQVVLQNMRVDFARPALLPVCPPPYTNPPVVGHCHPTSRVMTGRGRGMLRALPRMPGICSVGQAQGILGHSPVDIRGGRLEIAGVVVGSWGGRKGHLLDRGVGGTRGYFPGRSLLYRQPTCAVGRCCPSFMTVEEFANGCELSGYGSPHGGRTSRRSSQVVTRPGRKSRFATKGRGVTVDSSETFQKMVNVAADDQITGDVFHDMKDDSDGEGVEEWCV